MHVTYHVGKHDGGFAYRVGAVWSEPYASHGLALSAAKAAARRQQVGGSNAKILYQTDNGDWRSEYVKGGDRPDAEVIDDTVIARYLPGMDL
ncbi:hypothetical protein LCM4573_26355 [Rhizobium sp. LCM 4573]|nr:hypothetical protein [Rhizobium sp. LCM 4573]OHV78694.1 hypothetical protein LCM4573_26355 [Rhizobium sp. LCM 4573]